MQSHATTVDEYLAELPEDRRAAIQAVRAVILKNLDNVYEEGMSYGHIGYYVPHGVYPAGYHCDPRLPLPFTGLASQKHHMAIGIMGLYFDAADFAWFQQNWAKTGKKMDMGKCCIRFKKIEDVPLELIGAAIRRYPAKKYIALYEASRPASAKSAAKPSKKSAPVKKTTAKRPAAKKR